MSNVNTIAGFNVPTKEQLKAFYEGITQSDLTPNVKLYEINTEKGAFQMVLTVEEGNKAGLYLKDHNNKLVRSTNAIYNKMSDDTLKVGDQVMATVVWRHAVQGLDMAQVTADYAENGNAVTNYKREQKSGHSHLYAQVIHEDE